MNNKDRIKYNRKHYQLQQHLSKTGFNSFDNYDLNLLSQVPRKLYKFRKCKDIDVNTLRNRKAFFDLPKNWDDKLDTKIKINLEKDFEILSETGNDSVGAIARQIIKEFINHGDKLSKTQLNNNFIYNTFIKNRKVEEVPFIVGNFIEYYKTKNFLFATLEYESQKYIACNILMQLSVFNVVLDYYNHQDEYREKYPALCLSESLYNKDQWENYSDNYSGFCIEYDFGTISKDNIILYNDLVPMIYLDDNEVLLSDLFKAARKNDMHAYDKYHEDIALSLSIKETKYQTEKEWRVVGPKTMKATEFNFDFASAIYLGYKIEKCWEDKLIEVAKELNVDVYKQKSDNLDFEIIYQKK